MRSRGWWTAWFAVAVAGVLAAVPAVALEIEDMAGRSVEVPGDPERIVCIGPGTLRLVVYLEAQDKVAGVEEMEKINPRGRPYWLARPRLAELPRIGPGGPASINKKPDLEAILSVAPDLVFVTYMDAPLADEVQRSLRTPVVVLSYGEFAIFDEAVYVALRLAGRILNREERAEAVVGYIESLRKDLRRRTADLPDEDRARAYVGGIGYRGAHGLESTKRSYIPLDWVKAVNVAEEVESAIGSQVFVDKEILLKLDPEVVFIDGGGLALVEEDYRKKPRFYQALKAFRTGRVYTLLPFNFYTTNIGTALADAYAIGKILYPSRFEDVDLEKKADEIYTFLVGAPVYEAMRKDYGPIGSKAPLAGGER